VQLRRIVSRPFKLGKSFALTVAPAVREFLGYRPGDLLLLTMYDGYIVVTLLDPERILPRQEAVQVVTSVKKAFAAEASHA